MGCDSTWRNPGTSEFISDMGFLKIRPSADGWGISLSSLSTNIKKDYEFC